MNEKTLSKKFSKPNHPVLIQNFNFGMAIIIDPDNLIENTWYEITYENKKHKVSRQNGKILIRVED